jgi:hypothetical protein
MKSLATIAMGTSIRCLYIVMLLLEWTTNYTTSKKNKSGFDLP